MSSAYFGSGTSEVKISGLNCTGTESHIATCNFTGWGHITCKQDHAVGIICGMGLTHIIFLNFAFFKCLIHILTHIIMNIIHFIFFLEVLHMPNTFR